jgi:hypothetical protein
MDTKITNLLNGRRHRSVGIMKSAPNLTSCSLEPGVRNIGMSSNHSYRREPEPVVITDDVTNTKTPEKDQPSSDNKMNNNQNKYI